MFIVERCCPTRWNRTGKMCRADARVLLYSVCISAKEGGGIKQNRDLRLANLVVKQCTRTYIAESPRMAMVLWSSVFALQTRRSRMCKDAHSWTMRLENFWIFTKFDKIHAGFLRSGSANAITIVPFRLLCKLKAVGVLNGRDLTEVLRF